MSTALAVREAGSFVALNQDAGAAREIIESLLGGEPLTTRDLPVIGIPSAGKTKWELPDGDYVDELSGIILSWQPTHQYWSSPEPDGSPPQCRSTGIERVAFGTGPNGEDGDPGGPCSACPLNVMGSAENGVGKRCTERELWFLLTPGSMMPFIVSLSPGSLANARKYRRTSLAGMMVPTTAVVTSIGLMADTNSTGQKFSRAVPRILEHLDPAEAAMAAEYAKQFAPEFEAAAAEASATPIGEE